MNETGTLSASKHGLDQVLVETIEKWNETEKGRDGSGQVRGDPAKVLELEEETAKSANAAAHTDPEL